MKKITDWSAIFSIVGKTCFLCALAFMLSPLSVQAQCGQGDISGEWNLKIGDEGAIESTLELTQSGMKVSGEAQLWTTPNLFEKGKVKGDVTGDKVKFYINWVNEHGVRAEEFPSVYEHFEGTIGSDGKMGGQAYIFTLTGGVNVNWSSDRPMKCLYKTVHRLGTKPSTPTPTTTPTTAIAPMITASQVIPTGQTGQTVLTWDGGKDHPYAEVWVKVDDGDETFIVEQGKGSRQVTVEPGRTYLYILSDAGKRLAAVTVKSRQ
jgi:hypothetical protein